ncbi:MAG: beta-N-acetylhexosaminidase [Gammaproteobacteria bacterium]|tara:strand:- start:4756 stop:5766 length:1011 start_codon:yes stop_codon:yes gene_type:complete
MNKASLMVDIEGPSLSSDDIELIKSPYVGGLILFDRNFIDKDQLIDLCFEIKSKKPEIIIAVDQEGGRVQRLKKGFSLIPPMQKLGDLVLHERELGLDLCKETGWLVASELIACGVDLTFSPVLDLDQNSSSVIGDRAFSDQIDVVIDCARAFIFGMHEAGMASVGKHFPGHGSISEDSHVEKPIDKRILNEIENKDLIPFKELINDLDGIMTAHILFPEVDKNVTTFSKIWLSEILKEKMNFKGMIFSDDLNMEGANEGKSFYLKAEKAINAGCEMILVCNNRNGVLDASRYFEENDIVPSEKNFSMLMADDVSWASLEKNENRNRISNKLEKLK